MTLEEYQAKVKHSHNLRARKQYIRYTPTQWDKQKKGKEVEVSDPEVSDVPEGESEERYHDSSQESDAPSESEEQEPPSRPAKLPVRRKDANEPVRRVRMKKASNMPVYNSALRRLRNNEEEEDEEHVVPPRRIRRGRK